MPQHSERYDSNQSACRWPRLEKLSGPNRQLCSRWAPLFGHSEQWLRIRRGIDLKGSREAARNLILVRNSVVDFNISLVGIIGIRGKIDGIASQIVVEGLG